MNEIEFVDFGDILYKDIDSNEYLHELYENILYNYSLKLFKIDAVQKEVDIDKALEFADILSKSNHPQKADVHKIWGQEIVALLNDICPNNPTIQYYMGSVLSATGNYRGLKHLENESDKKHNSKIMLENLYTEFGKELSVVPAEREKGLHFFRSQKKVYDRLSEQYLSYSGPTSMGKSFVMRMFIKEQIMNNIQANFAIVVPSKALINEISRKMIDDLKDNLKIKNYRVITSAGALALKENHNFIFVLTPERLLYLQIMHPTVKIDYLFIDEAHKISEKGSRSSFYYKTVDMLTEKDQNSHIAFASPNIPNPEIYLKLVANLDKPKNMEITTSYSPVSQNKYLIDLCTGGIHIFNSYKKELFEFKAFKNPPELSDLIKYIGGNAQNLVYFNSKDKAIQAALKYAENLPLIESKELSALAKEIRNEVHDDYFLAGIINKGVAYHIGYLPPSIRIKIEELYRKEIIKTIFCTSTIIEGVNFPADNLFIADYRIGGRKFKPVDFKNLIGRVGRIDFNLYGNVFLLRLDEKTKTETIEKLLTKEVEKQKLSLASELTKNQKEAVVNALLNADLEMSNIKCSSEENRNLLRKFANILLRDIVKGRKSLVVKEFEKFLTDEAIAKIKNVYGQSETKPDDDINISIKQGQSLRVEIQKGLCYPALSEQGEVKYDDILTFLEKLYEIFRWDIYEPRDKDGGNKLGNKNSLKWYATLLCRWMNGNGLGMIISQSLYYYKNNRKDVKVAFREYQPYNDDNKKHKNIVIGETLYAIENVVLFSISNYLLKFSEAYKKYNNVDIIKNDWYEYVEYGTTNPLPILLQRCGFTRETSDYIRQHKSKYIDMTSSEPKLKLSLCHCDKESVAKEVLEMTYNVPELFIEE